MTNLETKLHDILTCKATQICSRAVPLFPALLTQMGRALTQDFHQWFCKEKAGILILMIKYIYLFIYLFISFSITV